jgi:hypothetical protein
MTDAFRAGQWRTWEDLAKHVASGELRETHTVELKRDDYNTTDGAKKELARDIAQLAIDGGYLIIGLAEDAKTGAATSVEPIALAGAVERVDQICESRISPRLALSIRDDLRSPDDPSRGVLVVEVPATGIPHMVDHTYFGRDNRRKRRLDNLEVVRLLARRDLDTETAERHLDDAYAVMGREGMPDTRLVISAAPIPLLRNDILRDQLASDIYWLDARMLGASERAIRERDASPALAGLTHSWDWSHRSTGYGTQRVPGGIARRFRYGLSTLCIIEVLESGVMRFALDTITDTIKDRFSDEETKVVYIDKAMSFACEALGWVASAADQTGLRGSFGIGMHVAGLSGAVRAPSNQNIQLRIHLADGTRYRDDTYRQVYIASGAELAGSFAPMADKLFGPLLRTLDYGDPLRQG